MADASYGTHIKDDKSHSSIIIFKDKSISLAKSVKQKLVTVSSTEAELKCMTEGLKQLEPIKIVLEELKLQSDKPVKVLQDSKSTTRLANHGDDFDGKSRHMRVRYHYTAEQIANSEIDIQYLESPKLAADIQSKPGGGSNFGTLVQIIVKDMPDI